MCESKVPPPRIEVQDFGGSSEDNSGGTSGSPVSTMDSQQSTIIDAQQRLDEARQLLKDASKDGVAPDMNAPFSLSPDHLMAFVDPKNAWVLIAMGGVPALEKVLVTNAQTGLVDAQLTDSEIESRQKVYGKNKIREKKQKSLFKIMLMTLNDKVLIILIVAAVISLALGLYETFGEGPEYDPEGRKVPKVDWVEGVAILVAVAIVTVVGSVNDWQKERQFAKLNSKKENRQVEAVRNGQEQQINIYDVQVGDVLKVAPGDVLPVDGVVLVSHDIQCDESSVTGESDTMHKTAASVVVEILDGKRAPASSEKDTDCILISGSRIMQGSGLYLATGVGENSMYGRTLLSLQDGEEVTPLQEKLNRIADGIAHFGVWSALILFIVLFIRFLVEITGGNLKDLPSSTKGNRFMDIFIVSVTIVVVAVPEGLPLAVTLALAFATTRMVKDNCLVRVLKSCETMGGATTVCSDKTGTLTQNKMTVVAATLGTDTWRDTHKNYQPKANEPDATNESSGDEENLDAVPQAGSENDGRIPPSFAQSKQLLMDSIAVNSSVYEDYEDPMNMVGSKTETALLGFARNHLDLQPGTLKHYRESRTIEYVLPFDSGRKYMATIIKHNSGYRVLVKGAAEILLDSTTHLYMGSEEQPQKLEKHQQFLDSQIDQYANDALRPIAVAYKDFDTDRNVAEISPDEVDISGLTFLGLFGIQDPLRPGVKHAVEQCRRAGVVVRMVTGDNMRTARAIAVNAAILDAEDPDAIVMEGPKFRTLTDSDMFDIVPRLRVLARSSPQDKRRLVEFLKAQGETVAVTGDGTNDAPALRLADVGFSMGMSGTEVAKEASDIIIMDDNFSSIVNAMKWGRTVNDAVKKFLQFQLTVNVTAVLLTFVSAVASGTNTSVLTAVQLLWVNLIMDTLAALALATDAPTDEVLDRPPDNRKKSLITVTMWKMIFGQALFQLGVTFVLHFAGSRLFGYYGHNFDSRDQTRLSSMVFNAFVWMQFFNMFVNRRLDNGQNLLVGITRNYFFPLVVAAIGGFQVLIMFVGGAAFSIRRNTAAMWATAIICGVASIPMGMLIRLVPDSWVMAIFPRRATLFVLDCLDKITAGVGWLFIPVTWLLERIQAGIIWCWYRVQGKSPPRKSQDDDERSTSSLLRERDSTDNVSDINPFDYQWMPGIEQSIGDLAMIRRVRGGGRLNQLNFVRRRKRAVRQLPLPSQRPSSNLHPGGIGWDNRSSRSRSTSASSLTALMAPLVLGGAVGGWQPMPLHHDSL